MDAWINCNHHMFEYFGRVTVRVVCDNLKTGVVMHPKNGEIVHTDTYSDFGNHYMTVIMPAQIRKLKQKGNDRSGREENLRLPSEFPFKVYHWFYSRKVQLNCHIAYKREK